MRHPETPTASAIAAVLILIPLPAQIRSQNVALIALLVGSFLINVIYLVNSLVWSGNFLDVAPVWCDIATTFFLYYSFLGEGAALCICKQLEFLCSRRDNAASRNHRRWFEFVICCVLPLLSIPIRYSMSSNRYLILEDLGCYPATYPASLAVALIHGPLLIIAGVAFAYACTAIWKLTQFQIYQPGRRRSAPEFVQLLAVSAVAGIWPLVAVLLCLRSQIDPPFPWPGWAAAHRYFRVIPTLPSSLQLPIIRDPFITVIWVDIITTYLVFVVLVCTTNVRQDIRRSWNFATGKVSCPSRRSRGVATTRSTSSGTRSQWLESTAVTESNHGLWASIVAGGKNVFPLSHANSSPGSEV